MFAREGKPGAPVGEDEEREKMFEHVEQALPSEEQRKCTAKRTLSDSSTASLFVTAYGISLLGVKARMGHHVLQL